jgi:hypothetical protein
MADKKKQSAVVVVATVMGITSVLSPVATVYAADAETTVVQQAEATEIKENAPPITLPQELSGNAGQALQDIALPDGWSWTDGNTIISKEKPEYPARIAVDDKTYDYSAVEGYNADGHYVECNLAVTAIEQKPVTESAPKADTLSLDKGVLSVPNAGDVTINDTNFPDSAFRYYVKKFDTDDSGTLSQEEINAVERIDVGFQGISDLTGIGYFTSLWYLKCDNNTSLTSLDVSELTGLQSLSCNNTSLTSLDVSGFTGLQKLYCSSISSLASLDVSGCTGLQTLYCGSTGLTSLDVSGFAGLQRLDCSSTNSLASLDVSGCTGLQSLDCGSTSLTSLDVSGCTGLQTLNCSATSSLASLDVSGCTGLQTLNCGSTGLTSLDVSGFTELQKLNCNCNTSLTSLDVSGCTGLQELGCTNTSSLASLNVSGCTGLQELACFRTSITSLDVSGCTGLQSLECSNTSLTSLDISRCTGLWNLNCDNCKLAWLNLGDNGNLSSLTKTDTAINNMIFTGSTFDLKELEKGMDVSKVTIISGGDPALSGSTVTGVAAGTPLVYEYDCGKSTAGNETLTVTVNLKGKSTIAVNDLHLTYTGKPITLTKDNCAIYGSDGEVKFTYEKNDNGSWTKLGSAPVNAGTYRVKAALEENALYSDAESDYKEFTIEKATPVYTPPTNLAAAYGQFLKDIILPEGFTWADDTQAVGSAGTNTFKVAYTPKDTENYVTVPDIDVTVTVVQAANGWRESLAMTGWTYGEKAVSPTAKATFGNVIFTYSDSEDGTYTDTVPIDAGTWYVKAAVAGTDNYTGLETTLAFTIAPKSIDNNSQIVVPDMKSDKDVENLVIKDGDKELKKGTDYDVSKKQDGSKVTVTITFKGNYTGSVTRTYTVDNKKPSGSTDTKKPSNSTKNDKNGAVQTGDTTTTGLWAMLMALSAGTVALLKSRKRKEETEE